MINFRVKDLDVLLAKLWKEGVEIIGEKQECEYGCQLIIWTDDVNSSNWETHLIFWN